MTRRIDMTPASGKKAERETAMTPPANDGSTEAVWHWRQGEQARIARALTPVGMVTIRRARGRIKPAIGPLNRAPSQAGGRAQARPRRAARGQRPSDRRGAADAEHHAERRIC